MAREVANRLEHIFLRADTGRRPCARRKVQVSDRPYWRDLVLVYEYFHGDYADLRIMPSSTRIRDQARLKVSA